MPVQESGYRFLTTSAVLDEKANALFLPDYPVRDLLCNIPTLK
jgi:hypothetical protein